MNSVSPVYAATADGLGERERWRFSWCATVHIVMLAGLLGLFGLVGADASSYGNGRCTYPIGSRTCQYNYNGNPHYYEVDSTSCASCTSTYAAHFGNAKTSWSNAAGPQWFTYVGGTPWNRNYTSVFVKQYPDYNDGNVISGAYGYTYNVQPGGSGACTSLNLPCNVYYSDVYVNKTRFDNWYATLYGPDAAYLVQGVFAHEFGHVQGLGHNSSIAALMYSYPSLSAPNGPVTADIGSNPPCVEGSSGNNVTIRCIYNYSN